MVPFLSIRQKTKPSDRPCALALTQLGLQQPSDTHTLLPSPRFEPTSNQKQRDPAGPCPPTHPSIHPSIHPFHPDTNPQPASPKAVRELATETQTRGFPTKDQGRRLRMLTHIVLLLVCFSPPLGLALRCFFRSQASCARLAVLRRWNTLLA